MIFACCRRLVIIVLASACGVLFAQESVQQPAANISGTVLTLGELEATQSGKLLQARYQHYLSERKALEDAIDERLLKTEAEKKNVSLDTLMDTVVYKGIQDPTEDQLKVYYEGLETQDTYENVRSAVLQHIRELRRSRARAAYVAELRKNAQISILLMPPTAAVNTEGAFTLGKSNAPVTLIEFADYQCPYCQTANPQIQRLKREFGESLTVIFKDFPLPMHASAQKAAEASRCAGQQGKFWEYHDTLFSTRLLSPDDLRDHARVLKLDTDRFDKCLANGDEAGAVKKDFQQANALGLSGTPSFFINGHFFSGAMDYAAVKEFINQQLNGVTSKQQMLSQK
ncbi:DsbA family protein [Occallatibacter riparius]|uniref:DsbA family protein n=1 Tax=Occallatibacter riparius TaxID=1002689 RepID=A0A9J7BHD5_9BACT|nr:DsbA family protein [Occallatibacter riparius]UWZ81929.1 DsbA family protein [Occallatibacter riparius]